MDKVNALRRAMAEKNLDAYIIPASDAHQSEYIADHWKTRQWLSGFTGSAGLVVVTKDSAGLWTDGRYFIQAEQELAGSGIMLFKMNEPGVPTYSKWLADNLPDKASVGFDGRVFSVAEFKALKSELKKKHNKKVFFNYNEDIAGSLWTDRPSLPMSSAFAHHIAFTGKTMAEKLELVREQMKENQGDAYLVAALDDIAWFANIRGNDIPNMPVVFSYLLITLEEVYLFIDEEKIDAPLREHLSGINICPYESVFEYVREKTANKKLLYCPEAISKSLFQAVSETAKTAKISSIIGKLKAAKNHNEIENIRNAFLKEGVVWVRLLKSLQEAAQKSEIGTEAEVQKKIYDLRVTQEHCIGNSFNAIVAYGKNAALMHYSPNPGDKIKPEGFLLIDTGGQYLDGTTDITRTIVMGPITEEMKRDFTLVLKGNINLSRAKFLQGVTGTHLDILARQPVWEAGMDYKSGTGHGLGFCLGVHEGPHNISMIKMNDTKLVPGMLCTNEPGIYKEGRYGIRTENVLLVKEHEKTEYGTFLCFEVISYCPIDTKAIDKSLLTKEELDYLNNYHNMVYEKLSPRLSPDEKEWLKEATKPI